MVSEAEEHIRLGRWTELSRGPVITLVEREVDAKTFRVVEHPGASCAVPVTPDGKVVLIRQFRPAIGEWIWEIPAKRVSKKVLLVQTVNVCHRYGSRIMMFAKLCAPPLGPRPFDFAQGDSGTD